MDWFGSSRKKESEDYEKEFLSRYKKQQKSKPKKRASKQKKVIEIESEEKNQDVEIKILKKEPEPLSTKFETAKQEYNVTIKNLMDTKKVLNGIKEDIQKSNSEYADIISKIKSTRVELLKANSELQEKTEEIGKTTEEQRKKDSLIQEINNSKMELSEMKEEIKKHNIELESVRTKVDNSPDVKKMKVERENIENEIIQKRKELDSGFRELKFIKDEMAKSSKNEGTEKIVDAASAVVASMNQKLQTTLTELDAVKKALENERRLQKKSTQLDQDI
jgi:chromosome segregation ATPase